MAAGYPARWVVFSSPTSGGGRPALPGPGGHVRVRCRHRIRRQHGSVVVTQLVVEALCLVELVFEGHDAAG